MSNQQPSAPSGGSSSPQNSVARSNVQLDRRHHRGSHGTSTTFLNLFHNIRNNYHSHVHSRPSHTETLEYLDTSEYESHRNRVREPVEGTCTWVTDHLKYKRWLGNTGSGLLWLSADPGCGKSVIASFLVAHLKLRPNAIVCYFFFKDDNEEQRCPTFALCALLHQLFTQNEVLSSYAAEAFATKGRGIVEEVDTLWGVLVNAVADPRCSEVICVVDALDECDERALPPLINHLASLSELQPPDTRLKFLVTGRPYDRIVVGPGMSAVATRLEGEKEVGAITADVNRVIAEGIGRLESKRKQPGELEDLKNHLESFADRTFLWVSLVLGILEGSDGSPEEFIKIASTHPHDLAPLYSKILNKSTDSGQARRVLGIVVAARRPLLLREMNTALGVKQGHKSIKDWEDLPSGFDTEVKNLCGLFVRVIDWKIYLVHSSAREFLVGEASDAKWEWQYSIDLAHSNFIMAEICMTYLERGDFKTDPMAIIGAADTGVTKYALLDYAAIFWAEHFRGSQGRQIDLFESTKRICEGGSDRFLTWLAVYWRKYGQYRPFPDDFTHLMIASWLGQGTVVEWLLQGGGDARRRSKDYGTALRIAVLRNDALVTRVLVEWHGEAYIGGKWYNFPEMTSDEFTRRVNEQRQDEEECLQLFFV